MPDHILRDRHINIEPAIVHLELKPHEVRQDGRGSVLRLDRHDALAWFRADDGQTGCGESEYGVEGMGGAELTGRCVDLKVG